MLWKYFTEIYFSNCIKNVDLTLVKSKMVIFESLLTTYEVNCIFLRQLGLYYEKLTLA